MTSQQTTLNHPTSLTNKIAVIDLETTEYNPRKGHIVEIGICLLDTQTGEITKLLDTPVLEDPKFNDWAWIFDNSSLTPEMVRKAPTWDSLKKSVQDICNAYKITAFNKEFDLGFLSAKGIKCPHQINCIMLACTPICQIPKDWGDPSDPFKWPKAIEAWQYFYPAIPYEEEHRAYSDSVAEAKILWALIQRQKQSK